MGAQVALAVPTFDLANVVDQLSHKQEYSHWTPERFSAAVEEYRRFLFLCREYPDQELIPGRDVDSIWHRHILNSRQYMADCRDYFGFYLHHNPHSRIEEGTKNANDKWLATLSLYEQVFGEKPPSGWLSGMSICNGGCDAGACSPGT